MRKHINKLALVASLVMLTSAFAAYSVGVDIDARIRAKINEGNNALAGYNTLEDTIIKATASVDNVSAEVVFEREGETGAPGIKFDSFNLTVSDLFGGLLTVRFFKWGYGAGGSYDEGDYILSDHSFYGVYATVKPIDIISLSLGYGVIDNAGGKSFRSTLTAAGPVAVADDIGAVESKDAGLHAIKFQMGVTGTGFPLNVYFGVLLNNSAYAQNSYSYDDASGEEVTVTLAKDDVGYAEDVEFGVNKMQVGADIKLYQNYLDVGIGITLPMGTAVETGDDEQEFVALVVLSGSAPILDTGLTVNYALSYSTESAIKATKDASGSAVNPLGYGFTDMMRVKVGLDWSLGMFTLGNMVRMTMGEVHVGDKVYNPIGVTYEPTIKLAFADGFYVKFLYTLAASNLSGAVEGVDSSLSHTLGMDVAAAFSVGNE